MAAFRTHGLTATALNEYSFCWLNAHSGRHIPDFRTNYLAARRDAIRDAAEGVFVRCGFDGATMQQIADEAGVSAGTIYRYFASKDELIRAVAQSCSARYAAQFEASAETTNSPLEILMTAGARIWDALGTESARSDAILQLEATLVAAREPAAAALLAESMGSMRRLIEGLLRDAQARGEIDATVDAAALATLLIATTNGIQSLALQMASAIDVAATWDVFNQLLAGIRSREVET